VQRDEQEIEHFLNDKFPRIQRLADKIGADIGFEDEAGVGVMTRHGRTWGLSGQTPIVKVSMQRGGYNVLSVVTSQVRWAIRSRKVRLTGSGISSS